MLEELIVAASSFVGVARRYTSYTHSPSLSKSLVVQFPDQAHLGRPTCEAAVQAGSSDCSSIRRIEAAAKGSQCHWNRLRRRESNDRYCEVRSTRCGFYITRTL